MSHRTLTVALLVLLAATPATARPRAPHIDPGRARTCDYLLAGSTNPALRELSVELALSLYLHWDADRFNDAFPQYAKGDLPSTT